MFTYSKMIAHRKKKTYFFKILLIEKKALFKYINRMKIAIFAENENVEIKKKT